MSTVNTGNASRADVLARLKKITPVEVMHPGAFVDAIRYDDVLAQFTTAATAAGAQVVRTSADQVAAAVALHPEWSAAKQVVLSSVEAELADGTRLVDPAQVTRLHDLAEVDVTVARGTFGVAENGAIWVATDCPGLRSALVTTQHLILVITADNLVHTMHEAYPRIDIAATTYGVFIAGPSKTADIEQSLVIGAHGPLSLTILLT
jgi:L-lactate dehydrogenase complex protein LldG